MDGKHACDDQTEMNNVCYCIYQMTLHIFSLSGVSFLSTLARPPHIWSMNRALGSFSQCIFSIKQMTKYVIIAFISTFDQIVNLEHLIQHHTTANSNNAHSENMCIPARANHQQNIQHILSNATFSSDSIFLRKKFFLVDFFSC